MLILYTCPMEHVKNDFSGKTMLIVEDCELSYQLLKEILEETGINILHATNGHDALKLCIQHDDIDIVLMDIKIPGMNGLKTTQRIKLIRPDLPILAQTASVYPEIMHQCEQAGCVEFIEKPIFTYKLMNALRKWLL